MTHTDLIARLREKTAGRLQAYNSRHQPIPFAVFEDDYVRNVKDPDWEAAADALTASQERIEALEEVIHNTLAAGLPEEVAQSARAALDAGKTKE